MFKKHFSLSKYKKFEFFIILLVPLLLTALVFRKYIFQGLLPIPSDIIPGLYFPWFDYKWGYATPIPVQNAAVSDVISILYPWRILAFRILNQGIMPLWDSSILLGAPLLANFQTAFFNPINILFLFLKEYHAWSIGVLIQPLLITFTTYLFLRELDLKKVPSLFGAMLFSFSGYSIVWLEYNSIDYTLVYFPLVLLSALKITKKLDLKWLLILSGSVCLQIVSGYPQNVIYSLIVAALYFLIGIRGEKKIIKRVTFFFSSIIFGIVLSSVQLAPSLELLNLSIRNLDKVALAGNVKFLPFTHLVTIFYPDYFGNPGRWNYFGIGSYDNFAFAIASVGMYFSLEAFLINSKIVRNRRFFIILLLSVLLFAIKNPLSEALSNIGVFGISSGSNTRSLFLISFVLSIFAAEGLQIFLNNKVKIKLILIPVVIYFLIFMVHLLFLERAYLGSILQLFKLLSGKINVSDSSILNLVITLRNMVIPSAVIFVVTISVLIVKNKNKLLLSVTVFALLCLSTLIQTDKYLSFVKKDLLFPSTEVTDYLQNHLKGSRFEKEKNNLIFPSNSWSLYGVSTATGQDASSLLSVSRYLSLINYGKINDSIVTRYNSISDFRSPLINTLNISYYTGLNWLNDSPDVKGSAKTLYLPQNFIEVKNIETVRIFKNTENLGPAWFPQSIQCEKNLGNIYNNIVKPSYDPKKLVYVDCLEGFIKTGGGTIHLNYENSNFKEFNVRANSDDYLIFSDAYYPGWEVYIDGVKVNQIDLANSALLAVYVSEGFHTVELKYNPLTFKIGLGLSGLALLVWLGILIKKVMNFKTKIN